MDNISTSTMNNNKRKNSDDDLDSEGCNQSDIVSGHSSRSIYVSDPKSETEGLADMMGLEENVGKEQVEAKTAKVMDVLLENSELQRLEEFPCQVPGCSQFFDTLLDYDTHYNMKHKHACATCKKTLLSPHFLELHVLETHDTLFELMAERRPMFQCYVESCKEKFTTAKDRHNHGVKAHGYPKNFMYSQNPNKIHWQQPKGSKHTKQKTSKHGSPKSKTSKENVQMDTGELSSECIPVENLEPVKLTKDKPPYMHISFGHKATKVFSRKHKFGMKPERSAQSTTACDMDLGDMKTAIEETEIVD